jgi:hypothetical protein
MYHGNQTGTTAKSVARRKIAQSLVSARMFPAMGGVEGAKVAVFNGPCPAISYHQAHETQAVTGSQAESDSCGGSFPDKGFNRSKPDAR